MAASTETKTEHTNDLGYLEVEAEKLRPMGDRILVAWEESKDELKVAGIVLERPQTHRKLCYTGVVLAVGPHVEDEHITIGARLFFDQFSNFTKLFDPKYGRLALISESQQASGFAVIPHRTKISGGASDFNYEAG
jgi:co-chaperonin GroES (HSP10)